MADQPGPFQPTPSDYQGPERREAQRFAAVGSHHLVIKVSDYDGRPVLQDISARGLLVLVPKRYKLGATVYVELVNERQGTSHTAAARIIRVTPASDGQFSVALHFVYHLTDEEFKTLIS